MVDLGQASTYAALSGASVGNTVSAPGAPHTTLRGDLGVKATRSRPAFRRAWSPARPGSAAAPTRRTPTSSRPTPRSPLAPDGAPLAGALAGQTVSPGLYTIPAAASNTGTLTLDGGGNPNAVFVFQINGALAFAAGSHVVLTNGAQASRVFWQVNGAGSSARMPTSRAR